MPHSRQRELQCFAEVSYKLVLAELGLCGGQGPGQEMPLNSPGCIWSLNPWCQDPFADGICSAPDYEPLFPA